MNPLPKLMGGEEDPIGMPERVVATWAEAVLHRNGQGTRGFGGRLFFYDRHSAKPIRVEGQLVVYAFVEDGRMATDHRPTKRYVFPPQQFAKYESESEIGASYSVWLPWDAVGGPQSEVSLIARFEPLQGGGLVVSDQARQRLPGPPRPDTMLAEHQNKTEVQQASYYTNEPATKVTTEPVEEKQTMTTTTISLPGRFMNRTPAATVPSVPTSKVTPAPANKIPAVIPAASATSGGYPATTTNTTTNVTVTNTPNPTTGVTASSMADLQPTPAGTTVQLLSPGESVRRSLQPRSFGSSQ